MSNQNKYKTETATGLGPDGERKQRDHTKTGKFQRRRDNRRLEAIARQDHRIKSVEKALVTGKGPEAITKYIATFKTGDMALQHAYNSLEKLRGGISHSKLVVKDDEKAVKLTVTVDPKPATTSEEKPKNKYRKRKSAKIAADAAPQK